MASPEFMLLSIVALIVFVPSLWAVAQRSSLRMENEAQARAQWERHYPEYPAESVLVASSQKAALVRSAKGIGLVWSLGANTVARVVTAIPVTRKPDSLNFALGEFAAPDVKVMLQPEEVDMWLAATQVSTQELLR